MIELTSETMNSHSFSTLLQQLELKLSEAAHLKDQLLQGVSAFPHAIAQS